MPNQPTQPLTHSQLGSTVMSPHTHSDLSLPNHSTIGQTPTEELRRILGKLGIEKAHSATRFAIVDAYAAKLKQILKDGGEKLVEEWWAVSNATQDSQPETKD